MEAELERLRWWKTQEEVRRISEGTAYRATDWREYKNANMQPVEPTPVTP